MVDRPPHAAKYIVIVRPGSWIEKQIVCSNLMDAMEEVIFYSRPDCPVVLYNIEKDEYTPI